MLVSCGDHVSIEQRVMDDFNYKACSKQWFIVTEVWIRKWNGFSRDLPYVEYKRVYYQSELDSIKNVEYQKAIKVANKIKECFDL